MNPTLAPGPRAGVVAHGPVPAAASFVERVVLVPLETPQQIATVLHLRDGIDLSVHAAAGRDFVELEKKEMRAGSSSASCSTVN
jgi:hypothetical protein